MRYLQDFWKPTVVLQTVWPAAQLPVLPATCLNLASSVQRTCPFHFSPAQYFRGTSWLWSFFLYIHRPFVQRGSNPIRKPSMFFQNLLERLPLRSSTALLYRLFVSFPHIGGAKRFAHFRTAPKVCKCVCFEPFVNSMMFFMFDLDIVSRRSRS